MSSVISMEEWLRQKQDNQENDNRLFLTEKEIRSSLHFKDASEEEVKNIMLTLHDIALLTYEAFCRETHQNRQLDNAA